MALVNERLKPEPVLCLCGCGTIARLQTRKRKDGLYHVQRCPCARCKGARHRRGGQDGQRKTAKRVGVTKIGTTWASHEEQYDGPTRMEIKVGAQIRPLITAFDKHRAQSEASRPIGDVRPFILHVRPQANSKRQLTTFESNSDDEYRQTLYALALHAGVITE